MSSRLVHRLFALSTILWGVDEDESMTGYWSIALPPSPFILAVLEVCFVPAVSSLKCVSLSAMDGEYFFTSEHMLLNRPYHTCESAPGDPGRACYT